MSVRAVYVRCNPTRDRSTTKIPMQFNRTGIHGPCYENIGLETVICPCMLLLVQFEKFQIVFETGSIRYFPKTGIRCSLTVPKQFDGFCIVTPFSTALL